MLIIIMICVGCDDSVNSTYIPKQDVIMPLAVRSWWEYNDSTSISDTVLESRLEVLETSEIFDSIVGTSVSLVQWTNLAEYGLVYIVGNEENGYMQYGAHSPDGTMINRQLQIMYPCSLYSSWNYVPIKYNITEGYLFEDDTVLVTCTDTAAEITVPAGTFSCVEYSFSYELSEGYRNNEVLIFSALGCIINRQTGVITEKLYYSVNIGYIKNVTLLNDNVIFNKVLTDYGIPFVNK